MYFLIEPRKKIIRFDDIKNFYEDILILVVILHPKYDSP
uniref:Uncharacterized protein n=1 Tax=viral metagenome TaxID=1070528 RepID=A0A6C0E8F7_9ZZZZ